MKKLEVLTNVIFLIVAVLIGVVLVRNHLMVPPRPAPMPALKVGDSVNISGIDWGKSRATLVLAVHSKCHFCTESAPFYRKLLSTLSTGPVRVSLIMPEPVGEGSPGLEYVRGLALRTPDVRQADFGSLKVRGTPTILLVDQRGQVQKLWAGKLSGSEEAEVLASAATLQ